MAALCYGGPESFNSPDLSDTTRFGDMFVAYSNVNILVYGQWRS